MSWWVWVLLGLAAIPVVPTLIWWALMTVVGLITLVGGFITCLQKRRNVWEAGRAFYFPDAAIRDENFSLVEVYLAPFVIMHHLTGGLHGPTVAKYLRDVFGHPTSSR